MFSGSTQESCLAAAPLRAGGRLALASGSAQSDSYEDVIRRAESLFNKIRYSVAQQTAPTTLKAAFLEPLKERMALDVLVDVFARSDAEFMSMFTGEHYLTLSLVAKHNGTLFNLLVSCNSAAPSALAQLSARRDQQQKRVDSLLKLKNEFQELSKIL